MSCPRRSLLGSLQIKLLSKKAASDFYRGMKSCVKFQRKQKGLDLSSTRNKPSQLTALFPARAAPVPYHVGLRTPIAAVTPDTLKATGLSFGKWVFSVNSPSPLRFGCEIM